MRFGFGSEDGASSTPQPMQHVQLVRMHDGHHLHLLRDMVSFQSEHIEDDQTCPLASLNAGILLEAICPFFGRV